LDELAKLLNNLFSIQKEPNQMNITHFYKNFQYQESKFYFSDYLISLVLFSKITFKEKIDLIFDALLLLYNRTLAGLKIFMISLI